MTVIRKFNMNINSPLGNLSIFYSTFNRIPLTEPARNRRENVLITMLDAGADVNIVVSQGSFKGYTAIFFAIENAVSFQLFSRVLNSTTNFNHTVDDKGTPLIYALDSGKFVEAHLILQKEQDFNINSQEGPALFAALRQGYNHIIQHLLDNNANVDYIHSNGSSALSLAFKNRSVSKDIIIRIIELNNIYDPLVIFNSALDRIIEPFYSDSDDDMETDWIIDNRFDDSVFDVILEKQFDIPKTDKVLTRKIDLAKSILRPETISKMLQKYRGSRH
jgi:hypothetical protein